MTFEQLLLWLSTIITRLFPQTRRHCAIQYSLLAVFPHRRDTFPAVILSPVHPHIPSLRLHYIIPTVRSSLDMWLTICPEIDHAPPETAGLFLAPRQPTEVLTRDVLGVSLPLLVAGMVRFTREQRSRKGIFMRRRSLSTEIVK